MLKHITAFFATIGLFAMPALAQDAGEIASVQNGNSCAGCNLFQADLSFKDAQKIDLSGSRLIQSNLSLSTYDEVNLSGANLSIANLFGARFNRSNFANTNLQEATAVGTFFGSSNLTGADLSGANLSGADLELVRGLTQSQLNAACGDSSTKLPSGKTIPTCS